MSALPSLGENITAKTENFTWTVSPDSGGHIVSMTDSEGKDWIGPGNFMLLDLATQQDYQQGDLKFKKYDCQKSETETKTVLVMSSEFTTRDVKGLKLSKTVIFPKKGDRVTAKYTLYNPTDHSIKAGLWIQNIVQPKAGRSRTTFRPSTKGTVEYSYPLTDTNYSLKYDFTFNFTQGFIGVMDTESKCGVAFLPDYNYLKCIYSNQGGFTQEWWYSDTLIKQGASFETSFDIVPFEGLDRCDYGSENYIMSRNITRDGSYAKIDIKTLDLNNTSQTDKGQKKIKITASSYPDRKILKETEADLTGKITETSLEMNDLDSKDDIIFNVYFTETGESFEVFSPGVAILFTETDYKIRPPKKIKNISKPDFTVRTPNQKPKIMEARGLFADKYLFKDISENAFDYSDSLYYSTDLGAGLKGFPEDYDDVFTYDLIILNHIPANAYTEEMWDFLKDYVTWGGKILFIGGPMCITGYDGDEDPSSILLPFPYRTFSKINRIMGKLENCGVYEYASDIKTDNRITDYLYRTNIGKGEIYFFTPLTLSQNKEKEGFWNNPNYPDFMKNLIDSICGGRF